MYDRGEVRRFMIMIPTTYPYGSVNIKCIEKIGIEFDKFYFLDKCGKWRIEEDTYRYLESRGLPKYERRGKSI